MGLFLSPERHSCPARPQAIAIIKGNISSECRFRRSAVDIPTETRNCDEGVAEMTKRWNISESLQSIAGGTFLGLGLHTLSVNLRGDAIQLRRLFDIPATDALGLLPSIALATSQAKGNALSHAMFLHAVLHMLVSLWPLLPVFLGTVLLRSSLTDKVNAFPVSDQYFRNKYFQNKGAGCRFRCPSFDV